MAKSSLTGSRHIGMRRHAEGIWRHLDVCSLRAWQERKQRLWPKAWLRRNHKTICGCRRGWKWLWICYGVSWSALWSIYFSRLRVDSEPKQTHATMPGPAQLECMRLKVLLRNKAEVRAALRSKGFSAARTAQLLAECEQSPPRNPVQRARQTAQDPPPKK